MGEADDLRIEIADLYKKLTAGQEDLTTKFKTECAQMEDRIVDKLTLVIAKCTITMHTAGLSV